MGVDHEWMKEEFAKNLKVDIFRPPGVGVNSKSNGVRITHRQTGTSVTFYKHKSLQVNKLEALRAVYKLENGE